MSRHKAIRNLTADDYEDYYEDDDGYGDDYGHSPSNDSYIYQRQPVAANITTKTTTKTPAKTTTTTNAAKPGTTSKTTPATTTSKPATTNVTKPTTTSTSKPTSTSTLKPTSTSTSTSTSKPTSTSTSTSTKKQALTQDDTYDHDYLDGGGGEYYDDYGYDDEEYWEQEPEYDDYDASAKPKSSTSTKTTPAKTTTSKPTTTPTTKKTVTSTTTTTSTSASKNATTVTSTSTSTSTKVTITSAETTPSKPLRTAEEMAETQAAIDAIRMAKMAVTDTSTTTSTSTSTPHKYSAAADIFDTPIPSTSTSTTSSAVQTPRGLPHSSTTAELSSHLPLGPVISRSASAALGPKEVYSAATSARLAREKESLLESESTRDMKPLLNMVVIGHVDAGKSTLMGHLLYLQGRVSSKLMHKFEKESKEMGKASFVYAWVLDEQEDERARGVTVDVAVNYFETPTKRITLLDAPGHKDFIPNMISGAAQADAAVLVIPAVRGEFESGFMDDGQTKEHAILARSLGVSQLIVAINKLDTMDWSQQRYQEIQLVLLPFLKSAGFKEKDVTFVPVSGLTGVNILTNNEPALRAWYTGPTLLDLIDAFQLPTRHVDKPFRMCIVDVFKSQSLGTTVCGKIESGAIIPRDRVLIQPLNEIATIKALESRGEPLNIAKAGDNVEIGLKDITDATALLPGQFLSDPTHPIPIVHRFRGQIITMAYKVPLLEGTQVILFTQSTSEPATITRLNALLDKTKGDITKKNPRAIPRSSSAIIEITVKRPICVELFRSYRELGRFTLRRQGDTVGVGIITKLFRELS